MKKIFSGVQPSGQLTLGNYITMMRHIESQNEFDCIYCIVDLHSITVPQDPQELRKNSRDLAALYIAMGLDPKKTILFIQSQVPSHTELAWLLMCNSYMGELNRMTQFKEKSEGRSVVTNGLYTYPILMAADILVYDTDVVPVGDDQKQHLELTRDIAIRFNNKFGETFVVPEPKIAKIGARIMSLDDPTKKMSKSNPNIHSKICILDSASKIKKSIMKSTTDSDMIIKYDPINKPGVSNLLEINSILSGKTIPELEKEFEGEGYGTLKKSLVEVTQNTLLPIQEKFNKIIESGEIDDILKDGAKRADIQAQKVVKRVKEKLGLIVY